jgi:biopolymer transport protein ExbD
MAGSSSFSGPAFKGPLKAVNSCKSAGLIRPGLNSADSFHSRFTQELTGPDTTSLADIIFLLLLFFLLSSTMISTSGLNIDLPNSSRNAGNRDISINILVDRNGDIYFRDSACSLDDIETKLMELDLDTEKRPVTIYADRLVHMEKIISLFEVIRRSGAQGIQILTKKYKDPQKAGGL